MVNRLALLIFIISISVLYAYWEKKRISSHTVEKSQELLSKLPDISLQTVNEPTKQIQLSNLIADGDELYLFHFWGTWCPPCIAEFPDLLRMANQVKDKKIRFVLVAVNDTKADIDKFLKPYGQFMTDKMLLLLDNSGEYNKSFGAAKVPESFLVDKNGTVLRRFQGAQDWLQPYYVKNFDDLLSR